jgi:hypothetical protein
VVSSGGTTPFLPPASITMLHSVILSSIFKGKMIKQKIVDSEIIFSVLINFIETESSRKDTFKLSTVEPTNSIDLYVAPDTLISPIICEVKHCKILKN